MRSTLAIAALAATAATVSASNCNPSYNTPSSGECFTNCNVNAGQAYVKGWTMDPSSPLFLDSLKVMCVKGTSEYLAFMSTAGMCMAKCTDDPTLFADEFAGACSWYASHANDTCFDANGTPSNTITTATSSNHSGSATFSHSAATSTSSTATSGSSKLMVGGYLTALVAGAAYLGF